MHTSVFNLRNQLCTPYMYGANERSLLMLLCLRYKISKASKSWWSTIMSGEGFVNKFVGPGTIFVQTRCLKALAGALIPYLPSTGGAGGESSGGDS